MGKIKKILENELVGGTQTTDVYPVTSVKAVYDENNERLDNIIRRRGLVNISTNYNSDHIAEVLTLGQAINKVPSADRVLGFVGNVLTSSGWELYKFSGESTTEWSDISLWSRIPISKSVLNSVVFSRDYSVNIDTNLNKLTVSNFGYFISVDGEFARIANGTTAIDFDIDNGIYFICFNYEDNLLHLISYVSFSKKNNTVIGTLYITGKVIQSIGCSFNISINGEKVGSILDSTGESTLSTMSQSIITQLDLLNKNKIFSTQGLYNIFNKKPILLSGAFYFVDTGDIKQGDFIDSGSTYNSIILDVSNIESFNIKGATPSNSCYYNGLPNRDTFVSEFTPIVGENSVPDGVKYVGINFRLDSNIDLSSKIEVTTKYTSSSIIQYESIAKAVVFPIEYGLNINLVDKKVETYSFGYIVHGDSVYSRIEQGETSFEVEDTDGGIFFLLYNKSDKLIYLNRYNTSYAKDSVHIGTVYITQDRKVASISSLCNIKINGDGVKGVINSIYGNSKLSSVSQKAISTAITGITKQLESIQQVEWTVPTVSMIENDYPSDSISLDDGVLSITNISNIKIFNPIIFDSKSIRFTPGTVENIRPWIVIGYKDFNNICLVGIRNYGWQFVNVSLETQKYTLLKSGNMNYEGLQEIIIDDVGGTIKWNKSDGDKATLASIYISDLVALGANLTTLTVGLCIFIVGSVVTGTAFSNISITKSVISGSGVSVTDDIGNSSTLAMSQLGVTNLVKPLKGKKLAIMGDSISTFSGYIPSGNAAYFPKYDVQSVEQTWWKKLLSKSEMTLTINQSWSGSRISNGRGTDSMFCAESRYGSLGSPDIIIVFGGTNDFGQDNPDCPLGEYVKQTDGEKDLQYFRQAYQFLVEKLQSQYTNSHLYICVPLQRNYNIWENNPENWSQQDLWNTIREIGDMYGINVIDLSKCGINHYNHSVYLSDGLHPNEAGMNLISKYIYKELLKGEYGYI